jgi:hypothetical protein
MPISPRWRDLPLRFLGFVLFFVVVAALPPQALYWDDIGFLAWARDPLQLDYGHALYTPTLRLWHELMLLLDYTTEEYAAKMLSSLFAAAVFLLLWLRLERQGLTRSAAFALAALVATTPFFWRQAGIVEPTTLTMTCLLCAASAAERYRAARSARNALVLVLYTGLAFGYHVVSVLALPWLVVLSWGRPRPPLAHLAWPIALGAAALLALVVSGQLALLAHFFGYWEGFLPRLSGAWLAETSREGWAIALHGFPLPLVLGALGGAWLLARRRLPVALALGLPYGVAFFFLGAPKVGLLVPVSLALGLAAGEALASVVRQAVRGPLAEFLLAGALAFQVGYGVVRALERAVTPDTLQEEANLMAAGLPRGSVLLAGPAAHHVLWFTQAPCIALPNEIHAAAPGIDGTKDVLAIVSEVESRAAADHAAVYISSEALDYLQWRWKADPSQLALDAGRTIVLRDQPALYLVPFARSGP